MKRIAAAGMIAAILTLFTSSTAQAEEGCVISVAGIKVCGTLVGQPLPPVVTVTVKPDPIRIPGPTVTLPPEQVPVPGPTETVTVIPDPEVVTVGPNNPGPSELPQPTATATVTVTETPTGQPTESRGTVGPSPEPEVRTESETRTKTETIVRYVLLGTLVSLALAGLGILMLYLGYILGQRDAKKQEDKFLESLLDTTKIRKRS